GNHLQSYSSADLNAPYGMTFDAAGTTAYIADSNQGNLVTLNGGSLSILNSSVSQFGNARDVALDASGNAYVLNIFAGPDGRGIYKVNISDGSHQFITDLEHSTFSPSNMTYGPGGLLYVTGIDNSEYVVRTFHTDGSAGSTTFDLGVATSIGPSTIIYTPVPEPATCATLTGLALGAFAFIRRRLASGAI
ncbi:MAG TPA: hypothetical protein VHH73_01010, partial [Verrucomicrobiae bacterium]|nr:hypothetical protein [Verrucomicrobiae bacterium]